MIGLILSLLLTSANAQTIDLSLEQQPCFGQEVMVDVIATSQGRFTERVAAVSVLIEYDNATLLRVETDEAGANWMIAGYLNDPDDINQDIADGLALLTLLSPPTEAAVIQTRCGTVLATLVFTLEKNASADIAMPLTNGNFGVTAVYPFNEVGVDAMGTSTGAKITCSSRNARKLKGE